MNYQAERTNLVNWVKSQLLGPPEPGENGERILRGEQPINRYPCGLIFPTSENGEGLDVQSDHEIETESDDEEDPSIKRRRYVPPSSVGFSFFILGEDISFSIKASAARYELSQHEGNKYSKHSWQRIDILKLTDEKEDKLVFSAPSSTSEDPSSPLRQRIDILEERAGIDLLWRKTGKGWLITVTLFNKKVLPNDAKQYFKSLNEDTLFETSLKCEIHSGTVGDYPRVDPSLLTQEERELELQYQSRKIYAIGHGAAVDWKVKDKIVTEIFSEFIPTVEVPTVTTEIKDGDRKVLELEELAKVGTTKNHSDEIIAKLSLFVEGYAAWVEKEYSTIKQSHDDKESADRIHQRMQTTIKRMHLGLTILSENKLAVKAFGLANHAMAKQMKQYGAMNPSWRPFQLAFLLTTIESIVNDEGEYRDIVDLIWFPTGGGKTEAYLGLIAFLIIWRRLKFPSNGGGTTAFMRYTLRLLTSQQFVRATRLICALELIRRERDDLGNEPISIGMWVGGATSPNSYQSALEILTRAIKENEFKAPSSFVVHECPWCGSPFSPRENYEAKHTSFKLHCTNDSCDFGSTQDNNIPCRFIDEDLYDNPPTLLIATTDKFARLAWEARANSFFGENGNRPPELIIQDELHLIASALGSIAGLYEAAIDTIIESKGVHPKVIASSATICMAEEQVRKLYGRELAIFPPPGFDCDDSYFAKTVPTSEKPGRLYLGYLASMLGRSRCLAPLATALLAAPEVIFHDRGDSANDLMEAWWSLIIYHGSIKGVGVSHNAIDMDVKDRLKKLQLEIEEIRKRGSEEKLHTDRFTRDIPSVAQLTGQSSAENNAVTFKKLENKRGEADCLDVALATNMISVGLDVGRLALMVINNQPLTTGEYIQASSRVGRDSVPGIVFANYYRDQARSLSFYESFKAYHESFYRFVEPNSITPFTYQARQRALHAALVISIRHAVSNMLSNDSAGAFNPGDEQTRNIIETLKRQYKKRCWVKVKNGDDETMKPDEVLFATVVEHLDRLKNQWRNRVQINREDRQRLEYSVNDNDKSSDRLLYNHHDKILGLWPTLQSMRNVEETSLIKLL